MTTRIGPLVEGTKNWFKSHCCPPLLQMVDAVLCLYPSNNIPLNCPQTKVPFIFFMFPSSLWEKRVPISPSQSLTHFYPTHFVYIWSLLCIYNVGQKWLLNQAEQTFLLPPHYLLTDLSKNVGIITFLIQTGQLGWCESLVLAQGYCSCAIKHICITLWGREAGAGNYTGPAHGCVGAGQWGIG